MLPEIPHGVALPDPATIDVETLRGRRAVHRWERTAVGDLFERVTWSHPDKPALVAADGAFGEFPAVTYREADAAANRFANALAAAGLVPGDRVLLICENTVDAMLAKIGIAKAGMVAVPLNPGLAPDVLEHLIGRTAPRFTVVDAELWPRVEQVFAVAGLTVGAAITVGGAITGSPSLGELLAGRPDTEPEVEIHGDDVWQLLFTSGTTAMPKGVMLSHSYAHLAALNFAISLTRGQQHDSDLHLCTFLPMIYHVGEEIFPFATWVCGGTVTLGRRPAPEPVLEAVMSSGATTLWAGSPQFVTALADTLDARPDLDVSCMTALVYGWGALSPAVLDRLGTRAAPGFGTLGIFGQTEAIACHRFWPTRWPDVHARTAPAVNYVGVPSGMLASDVVDGTGDPVRGGEPGEAVYRSPIMTAGYYRDVEATREAFRGGWFHSGDSASIDGEGLRVMVDRYKDIVKTGGENVSSIRVEAVLHEHPDVLRAAVIGLPHPHWGEAVTAVVVPREGRKPEPGALIAFCRERLAGYETPKAVVFAQSLPDTVGGKVLKYRLRETHSELYS